MIVQQQPPQAIPRLVASPSPSSTSTSTSTSSRPYPSKSAAARWQAVVTRDPTANFFVYAVLTTRIYCRPSCPGRLARRANVQFYDSPTQAEVAGFRACKRCKPQMQHLANPQIQLIQRACATIEEDISAGERPTLRTLAAAANLTPSHFHRVFKKTMGVTPGQYVATAVERGTPSTLNGEMRDPGVVVARWNDFDEALVAAGVDLTATATGTGTEAGAGAVFPVVEIPGAPEVLDWDLFVEGL